MDLIEKNFKIANRHPWEIARLEIISEWIFNYRGNSNHQILDIGSGDAFIADGLTNMFRKSNAYCVDNQYTSEVKDEIENCFANNRLKIYSSLNDIPDQTDKMGVVTLLDVLEHVPDDIEFLNDILLRSFISDETLFFITVPAYQTLYSRHDVFLNHYRRYNLCLLKMTLDKCDLKVIEGGYFFFSLIIPRIFQLLIEKGLLKNNTKVTHLGKWNGGRLMSLLIKRILLIDYTIGRIFKFIGLNLPGLSCYAIAIKQKSKHYN